MTAQRPLPPTPRAIHLRRPGAASTAVPRVPFGLPAWSDDPAAPAVAIELGPLTGRAFLDCTKQIADALPAPESLPAGSLVIVLGEAPAQAGLVARFLHSIRRTEPVARSLRASALLARGYTRIGAARDEASAHDLVWGFAPA
ncbi:hypothetical protein [Pendulispora albinea]|uniref:Uncharacterized protein n=1 Tax=Pendulispora albinea TaxID=2741071 RepID=A0ABZ2M6L4_9BACT